MDVFEHQSDFVPFSPPHHPHCEQHALPPQRVLPCRGPHLPFLLIGCDGKAGGLTEAGAGVGGDGVGGDGVGGDGVGGDGVGDDGPGADGPGADGPSSPPIMRIATLDEDDIIIKTTTPIMAAWDIFLY
jgi:hypothetical protein